MDPAEQPNGHRRLVGCFAVVIISVGLIVAVWLSRGVVVSGSYQVNGETIDCWVRNSRGTLSFHAEQDRGMFARGWSSVIRMGDTADFGTHDAQLSLDAARNRILVQVGRGKWEFDPAAHYLQEMK